MEKVGSDDYVTVLCNAQILRDQGVEIPKMGKSQPQEKAEAKKMKK